MANNHEEASPDRVRELLRYTVDDLGGLVTSTVELSKTDPQSAQQIAAEALGILADSSVRFASILTGNTVSLPTPPEASTTISSTGLREEAEKPEQPIPTEGLVVAYERVGALEKDPTAQKSIEEIRLLKEKVSQSRWGISSMEDLEQACRLIYGLDMGRYLEEAYDVPLALPDTDDFKPFQLVLRDDRIACLEGTGCPATPSNRLIVLNLMAMSTYFTGIKSSTIANLLGKSLSTMLTGGFYNTGYVTNDILKRRGGKNNLTYELRPGWRAEGILGHSAS